MASMMKSEAKIRIKKNKDLELKPTKMTCDDFRLLNCNDDPPAKPLPDQPSFFMVFYGAPGSGKTSLCMSLLKNKNGFFQRFEKVYLISPSMGTLKNLIIPEENCFSEYSPELIDEIIEELREDDLHYDSKVLFIFDDIVAQLKGSNNKEFTRLVYNRRHLIGAPISIMLISQKIRKIPLELRSVVTHLCAFKPIAKPERETLKEEYINLDDSDAEFLLNTVYKNKHDFLFVDCNKHRDGRYYRNFDQIEFIDE